MCACGSPLANRKMSKVIDSLSISLSVARRRIRSIRRIGPQISFDGGRNAIANGGRLRLGWTDCNLTRVRLLLPRGPCVSRLMMIGTRDRSAKSFDPYANFRSRSQCVNVLFCSLKPLFCLNLLCRPYVLDKVLVSLLGVLPCLGPCLKPSLADWTCVAAAISSSGRT